MLSLSKKEISRSDIEDQMQWDGRRGPQGRECRTGELRAATKLPLSHLEQTLPFNTTHISSQAVSPTKLNLSMYQIPVLRLHQKPLKAKERHGRAKN